jgi:hypothetical protein
VPWRHRHTTPRDGQEDEHQAGIRSVIKALTANRMFTAAKNGKGKMKPVPSSARTHFHS